MEGHRPVFAISLESAGNLLYALPFDNRPPSATIVANGLEKFDAVSRCEIGGSDWPGFIEVAGQHYGQP